MKLISMLLVVVFLSGCTTVRTIECESGNLREQLADGYRISPGEVSLIETIDGEHHKFRVKKVTDDYIEGENVKVSIDDVVSISTDHVNSFAKVGASILGLILLVPEILLIFI